MYTSQIKIPSHELAEGNLFLTQKEMISDAGPGEVLLSYKSAFVNGVVATVEVVNTFQDDCTGPWVDFTLTDYNGNVFFIMEPCIEKLDGKFYVKAGECEEYELTIKEAQ